jgi:uncharacterized membrane protein YgcG
MYKLMTITALSLVAIPTFANQNMTCISDGAFVHCNLDQADHRDITIKNVIAGDCLQANVWGVDSTGIWVDKGCGATFEYTAAATTSTASVNNNYTDSATYNEGYSEDANNYNEPWYYAPWLFEPWLPYYNYYPYYGSQVFYYGNGEHHEAWHGTHDGYHHNGSHESFHGTSQHNGGMNTFHGTSHHNGGMNTFHGATNTHSGNISHSGNMFHDGNTSHGGGSHGGGGGFHGGGKKH